MNIKLPNNSPDDYAVFDIHDIIIEPFNNVLDPATDKPLDSTGWYITVVFSVDPSSSNFLRFLNHNNYELNGFYLDYVKDTNTFTFKEAVTKTPTTIGALEELNKLKTKTLDPNYRFIATSYLYHCIEILNIFWD